MAIGKLDSEVRPSGFKSLSLLVNCVVLGKSLYVSEASVLFIVKKKNKNKSKREKSIVTSDEVAVNIK